MEKRFQPTKLGIGFHATVAKSDEYTQEQLLEAIEGTELRVTFDVGHAHHAGFLDEWLDHVHLFRNFHIHDNDGSWDQHAVLGSRTIPFDKVLKAMEPYKGSYIIECSKYEEGVESKGVLEGWLD